MRYPTSLTKFKVYVRGANEVLWLTDIELPTIKRITNEVDMAGTGGKLSIPSTSQLEAMQVKLNSSVPTSQIFAAAARDGEQLVFRGSVQAIGTSTHGIQQIPMSVYMAGNFSELALGTAKQGEGMGNSVTFEVTYLQIYYDNEEVFMSDKINGIIRINGRDLTADVNSQI